VGIVLWLSGDLGKAREHLRWVREHGDPDFVDYSLALLLLPRLEKAAP
jgi:hypothetical protein